MQAALGEALFSLGPSAAVPLLEYSLGVYRVDLEALAACRPDVVITQVQGLVRGTIYGGHTKERKSECG
jgi:hypothetical protein